MIPGKRNSMHIAERQKRAHGKVGRLWEFITPGMQLYCWTGKHSASYRLEQMLVSEDYVASQSTHLTTCHNTLSEFLQVSGQKVSTVKNNLCPKYLVSCIRNKWMENSVLIMMLCNKQLQTQWFKMTTFYSDHRLCRSGAHKGLTTKPVTYLWPSYLPTEGL